jgi:hypothetical protein
MECRKRLHERWRVQSILFLASNVLRGVRGAIRHRWLTLCLNAHDPPGAALGPRSRLAGRHLCHSHARNPPAWFHPRKGKRPPEAGSSMLPGPPRGPDLGLSSPSTCALTEFGLRRPNGRLPQFGGYFLMSDDAVTAQAPVLSFLVVPAEC